MDAHTYAQHHADRFIEQLIDLLKIPSISTLAAHAPDVQRAAEWLIVDMQRIGMTRAEIFQSECYLPLVYGEWSGAGEDAPTVLIYCHYDVQPAEIADGWETNPFEPVLRDGKIYARGAVDSKGHVLANLKAVESLLAAGDCPVNIKLLFEGEEESGSEHIFAFVAQNPILLRSDVIIVSDGSLPAVDQPVLGYGLRGIVTMDVSVQGPGKDLHSGHYGGTVHNPIQALTEILSALHDADGRVTVPGFYDAVCPLTEEERAVLADIAPYVQREWDTVTGASEPWGESDYALHERIGARPTLEINGIAGGFYGEGVKTVLPARAIAKVSCRLVPDQDPTQILEAVKSHLKSLAPTTVQVDVNTGDMGAKGILLERDSAGMRTAYTAYERGWGVKPIFNRDGGSVPVIQAFQEHLDGQIVLLPYGYKGCGAHGPNEHMYVEMFHKGVATTIHFCQLLVSSFQ